VDFYYFSIKCSILLAYYSLLQYLGLGLEYKFWSFIILSPIVKFFYFQKDSDFIKRYITSLSIEYTYAIFFYKYLIYWDGYWMVVYPFIYVFWLLGTEYLQYMILGKPEEKYEIKASNNPTTDFLVLPIVSSVWFLFGITQRPELSFTPWSFVAWVLMMIHADILFGIAHYMSHSVPSIRKLHLVHHEYRKEDLNTMANFYSEIYDTLIMNLTNFTNVILTVYFAQQSVCIKEILHVATSTHHKYVTNTSHLFYFFLNMSLLIWLWMLYACPIIIMNIIIMSRKTMVLLDLFQMRCALKCITFVRIWLSPKWRENKKSEK